MVAAADHDGFLLAVGERQETYYLPAADQGLRIEPLTSLDLDRGYGLVVLDGAQPGEKLDVRGLRPEDLLLLLDCADILGGLNRALDLTVAYAGERETFGAPIGRNQAVQYRLVDHAIALRGASLLVTDAAAAVDACISGDGPPAAAHQAVLAAASYTARHAAPMASDLIQLTGAIGFTWEYGLHVILRRATQTIGSHGGHRALRRELAAAHGWGPVGAP